MSDQFKTRQESSHHSPLRYQSGFRNEHSSEALPRALPIGQNSPQRCEYGLYAEQLSGSAFTAPRQQNLRSWLYRVRPSVQHHGEFKRAEREAQLWLSAPLTKRDRVAASHLAIGPRRWTPLPIPPRSQERLSFLNGIRSYTLSGSVDASVGMAAHLYVMNSRMIDPKERGVKEERERLQHLVNADAELLIIPQEGALRVSTEFGLLDVAPSEIVVIPRGVTFRVDPLALVEGETRGDTETRSRCRGYICENYGAPLELPQLGPIGANGLANPRDFLSPVAAYDAETLHRPSTLFMRWGGELYRAELDHSPLDVVAWHGNYAPYKYDLERFSTIGSISFDHPDPSIFTVLTSPSNTPGVANVDFVIFPDRWLVAEHTFRPPWYHRNIMSEFMGLIKGAYDAKEEGFLPGGVSLHNQMLAHGPDASGFDKASAADLEPQKLSNTLAFMLETRAPQHVTPYAASSFNLEAEYRGCWGELKPAQLPSKTDLSLV